MSICKSSGSPERRVNVQNLSLVRFSTVTSNTPGLDFGIRHKSCTSLKHRNDDSSLSAIIRASFIFFAVVYLFSVANNGKSSN